MNLPNLFVGNESTANCMKVITCPQIHTPAAVVISVRLCVAKGLEDGVGHHNLRVHAHMRFPIRRYTGEVPHDELGGFRFARTALTGHQNRLRTIRGNMSKTITSK